ncbi:hypothetical protein [Undibacterium sp. KW1]|uniref:hypothetical protein n=1 Tax=Undibacterium sp. KW1 TaxID=2058624 RepID=UPI00138A56F1|nr:hypothetical protein [Undibacterium sp. KW1]
MKISSTLLIAASVVLSNVAVASTTPSAKPAAPNAKQAQAGKFSIEMLAKDKLPANFKGVNLIETINALEKMSLIKKGEFETTADFDNRKAKAYAAKLPGGQGIDDYFAFAFPVSVADSLPVGFRYKYDADAGDALFYMLPTNASLNGIGSPNHDIKGVRVDRLDALDFDLNIDKTRTYRGSNAYGATVNVEETSTTVFGLASPTIPFLDFKREVGYYRDLIPAARVSMPSTIAAKELPAIKALVVAKITQPYLIYDFYHSEPTRDNPKESYRQKKYLSTTIEGVIFYSPATGQIIARLPDGFGLPAKQ